MRIGIYHQHRDRVTGGAEAVVFAMAEALAASHDVVILHHRPDLDRDTALRQYGLEGTAVRLAYLSPPPTQEIAVSSPWRRYWSERGRYAEATRSLDLLIASVHTPPPFCHAARGALYVHFPSHDPAMTWPFVRDGNAPWKWLRRRYAALEWAHRFGGYTVTMVNSQFTARYTREWWDLDPVVIYPPGEVTAPSVPKQPQILSVGRFIHPGGKGQLDLVRAFGRLAGGGAAGWTYRLVGEVHDTPDSRTYFRRTEEAARDVGAVIETRASRSRLESLFQSSSLFWHAMGYGIPEARPQWLEHFGIVTVEAMSAGCVPMVYRSGGQPEIVEDGRTGFLWDRPEELLERSAELIRSPQLLQRMAAAAAERARHFSRAAFRERLRDALRPVLEGRATP